MLNFPNSRVEICHVEVSIPHLTPQYEGLRVIQLSDFHYDHRTAGKLSSSLHPQVLPDLVRIVHSLQPDLVCYTGDFINGNPASIQPLASYLGQMTGRLGSFAVLGNHDYLSQSCARHVTEQLENAGIQVLKNQVSYPIGPGLAVVGFECLWQYSEFPAFDPSPVINQIAENIPKIVLAHSPRFSEYLTDWPIELQLSGHTHGGQLVLPGIGPLLPQFWRLYSSLPRCLKQYWDQLMPRRLRMTEQIEWLQGAYHINQGVLYVNRGLGAHKPGRLFCRPEITVITLLSSPVS